MRAAAPVSQSFDCGLSVVGWRYWIKGREGSIASRFKVPRRCKARYGKLCD
jgi:hypothetical protein